MDTLNLMHWCEFQFEIKERKKLEDDQSPEDILKAKEEKLQRLIAEFMPPPKP